MPDVTPPQRAEFCPDAAMIERMSAAAVAALEYARFLVREARGLARTAHSRDLLPNLPRVEWAGVGASMVEWELTVQGDDLSCLRGPSDSVRILHEQLLDALDEWSGLPGNCFLPDEVDVDFPRSSEPRLIVVGAPDSSHQITFNPYFREPFFRFMDRADLGPFTFEGAENANAHEAAMVAASAVVGEWHRACHWKPYDDARPIEWAVAAGRFEARHGHHFRDEEFARLVAPMHRECARGVNILGGAAKTSNAQAGEQVPPDRPARKPYREVADAVEKIVAGRKTFPGINRLAESLKCSPSTVKKAINRSTKLQNAYATYLLQMKSPVDRRTGNSGAQFGPHEPADPAEAVADEELFRMLVEEASAEQRASLHNMTPAERREAVLSRFGDNPDRR